MTISIPEAWGSKMSPGTVSAASSFSELELLFPVAYEWETGQMTGPISSYP